MRFFFFVLYERSSDTVRLLYRFFFFFSCPYNSMRVWTNGENWQISIRTLGTHIILKTLTRATCFISLSCGFFPRMFWAISNVFALKSDVPRTIKCSPFAIITIMKRITTPFRYGLRRRFYYKNILLRYKFIFAATYTIIDTGVFVF